MVPDGQLHTNGRRCWSSTSAVCQSAEVDRSTLSSEQFWSSVFYCCGPLTWNSLPNSLCDPALSLNIFRHQLKTHLFCEILIRCTERIRDFFENALYKLTLYLLYLLTYSLDANDSSCCSRKHRLQSLNDCISDPIQNSITVVDATCDEGVDKSVQGLDWHRSLN